MDSYRSTSGIHVLPLGHERSHVLGNRLDSGFGRRDNGPYNAAVGGLIKVLEQRMVQTYG